MILKRLNKIASFYLEKNRVPEYLYLDIASICNANCIFCAYQYDSRDKAVMDDELFRNAVDEYKEIGGKKIGLTPILGEALIDPKIIEKLEYLKYKGFQHIHFYTNLSLLHKFDTDRFLRSGVTALHISTAPLVEEVYTKIYRAGNYRTFLDNLRGLLKSFITTHDKTLKNISVEFRSDRPLEECVCTPDFKEYVEPYLNNHVSVVAMRAFDSWNGVITESDLLEGMNIKSPDCLKVLPCQRLFIVHVMVNGDLRLCGCRYDPFNREDELVVGNIKGDTLSDVYNSKKVSEIVGSFFRRNAPKICKNCSWYG